MGRFIKVLEENYVMHNIEMDRSFSSKEDYLSSVIFNFDIYDSDTSVIFAQKMISVLSCISNETTFEYINHSNANYMNYLTMINMPFLKNKIEWGTSVRGAWLDDTKSFVIDCGRITVDTGELILFVGDILTWVRKD